MAEHRPHEPEIGQRRALAKQERTVLQDRFQPGQIAQIDAFDMAAVRRRDPIAAHIFVLLALGNEGGAQAKRQGQVTHHFRRNAPAHQAAVGLIAPAIVQGWSPEPLVGIVLNQ